MTAHARRRRALLGLALFLVALLAGPAHFALVPHGIDAAGGLVHACGGHGGHGERSAAEPVCGAPAAPVGRDERGPRAEAPAHRHAGGACALELLARIAGDAPASSPPLPALASRAAEPCPRPTTALLASTRFLLAPKQSPPGGA